MQIKKHNKQNLFGLLCVKNNTYPITIKIILWNDYYTFKNKFGTETYSSLIINNYLKDIPNPFIGQAPY
jgi:hypothetical protein